MSSTQQSKVRLLASELNETRTKIYASLVDHALTAGITVDDLGAALDVLDRLAGWAVNETFTFPRDSFGNPSRGEGPGSTTPEWRLWSAASTLQDDVSWAAEVLRSVHAGAEAKAVRA